MRFDLHIQFIKYVCSGFFAFAIFVWAGIGNAHAAELKGRDHLLSTGAGIAAPSDTSALLENPAGFVYDEGVKVLFTGSAYDSSDIPSNVGLGAGIFLGNGTVGGAVKYDYANSNSSRLSAGLAVDIKAISSSIGAACGVGLNSGVGVSCTEFGLLVQPTGKFRVGAQLSTVNSGIVGGGIAGDATNDITLAFDASANLSGGGMSAKPGALLKLSPLHLALGYGFNSGGGTNMISSGLSVGIGFELGSRLQLQGYYGQLAQYFVGLAIKL